MTYSCRRCGYIQAEKWPEECPGCGGLYRAKETGTDGPGRSTFAKASEVKIEFFPTTVDGFDKVLGGGLVEGTSILLGGTYGAGKSTLAVGVTAAVANKYGPCLYASAEEGVDGVLRIVKRLGVETERVELLAGQTDIWHVLRHARKMSPPPLLFVVDSLTKFSDGPKDDKAIVMALSKWARERKGVALLINQVAKSGDFKGSTEGTHGTDIVMTLGFARPDDVNAPAVKDVRILYSLKSRLGSTTETYWRMSSEGRLECVPPRPPKPARKKRAA
jgi:DNA repair protein RadA/Sms